MFRQNNDYPECPTCGEHFERGDFPDPADADNEDGVCVDCFYDPPEEDVQEFDD